MLSTTKIFSRWNMINFYLPFYVICEIIVLKRNRLTHKKIFSIQVRGCPCRSEESEGSGNVFTVLTPELNR